MILADTASVKGNSMTVIKVLRMCGLAAALAVLSAPAWAGHRTVDMANLSNVIDLAPGGYGDAYDVTLRVEQVYNPGMSDKRGCRMQVSFINTSKASVNVRVLVNTFDSTKQPADTNLVPSGDLAPGKSVMRLFSCIPAETVEASRDNQYGWPVTCDINGTEQSPCPVMFHFSSTLEIIPPK